MLNKGLFRSEYVNVYLLGLNASHSTFPILLTALVLFFLFLKTKLGPATFD